MARILLSAGMLFFLLPLSFSQQMPHLFMIKTDLTRPFNHGISLSVEWHWQKNGAWEILAAYDRNPDPVSSLWTIEYAIQKTDFQDPDETILPKRLQFEYVGVGRPLPPVPLYAPLPVLQFGLAHRFYFETPQKRWRVILQAGPMISHLGYSYTRDETKIVGVEVKSWAGGYGTETRENIYYQQTRQVSYHEEWRGAISCGLGVLRLFKGGLSLEARFSEVFNVGAPFGPELRAALPKFRQQYGRGSILLGYSFG